MGLSVIVPSKTDANVVRCAEAVRKHEPGARIIVVDDGLKLDWLPRPDLMPAIGIRGAKPFVFARNCNLGIVAAGSDDVALLNDDALLESPGGFSLLQQCAAEHQEFGIIGATTNVTGQPLQWRKDVGLREVPSIAFVCVLIPRRTIDLLGMLDERYCLGYGCEDADYCEAAKRAGLKIGVHDGCFVDHASLHSSFRGEPHSCGDFSRNLALFNQKWGL